MKRNTENNREYLIAEVIDRMDMDALIEVARDVLEKYYKELSKNEFTREWEDVFGKE